MQGEEAIALPFSKVEELTGKPLCKSAYKYASYWYPAQDKPLSNTIYNAGYDVDRVDLAARIVYLTKAAYLNEHPALCVYRTHGAGRFCVFSGFRRDIRCPVRRTHLCTSRNRTITS